MSRGYLRLSCRRLLWAEHLPSGLRDRRCLHYGQRLRCAPALPRRALRAAKDRHLPIDQTTKRSTVERLTLRASARCRDGDEIAGEKASSGEDRSGSRRRPRELARIASTPTQKGQLSLAFHLALRTREDSNFRPSDS